MSTAFEVIVVIILIVGVSHLNDVRKLMAAHVRSMKILSEIAERSSNRRS